MNILSDSETRVSELREQVQKFITDRDWSKYHNPKDISVSITIEASELLEVFQWVRDDDADDLLKDPIKLNSVKDELADIIIYCLSLANSLDIDVSQAVTDKIEKNKRKYPREKIKGNYRKYTELE